MSVARIWTNGDEVCAIIANPKSLSDEWAECGADRYHDIQITSGSLTSGEILSAITFEAPDSITISGHTINIVSSAGIT